MTEEFINCGNCGRAVPKTMYCIYCGSALQGSGRRAGEDQERRSEQIIPDFKFEPLKEEPIDLKAYGLKPLKDSEADLDRETLDQIKDLRKYRVWQLKLCGMLSEIGVSEEVFTKIYEEYSAEVERLRRTLEEKRTGLRRDYEAKMEELESMEKAQEELQVRVAVGELPSRELQLRAPTAKEAMDRLKRETSGLETTLLRLEDIMGDIHPEEVAELEGKARRSLQSLDTMVAEGRIGVDLARRLRDDLHYALSLFEDSAERKEAEEALRDELETLEVRYKVGEITLEEFESGKRDLQERINRL